MKKLYILLALLLSQFGGAMAQAPNLELPFIYQLTCDMDIAGLPYETPFRFTNNEHTSILSVPYEGISPGCQYNVVGTINQLLGSVRPDGLIQCIEVSGINMSDPQASKGLIYLRFEANSLMGIAIFLTAYQQNGAAILIQDPMPIDPSMIKYGLDYYASGTNTLFTVTGPQLPDGCTFTLRKVTMGQQAHTWPVAATFTSSLPFNPSNLPSGVLPVSSSLLTSGDYVLYNDMYGVIASNAVTIGAGSNPEPLVLTTYSISGGGEIASGGTGTVTLSGKQDQVTYKLYLNDNLLSNTLGSNNSFTGLTGYGRYRVKAVYQTQETWMSGEVGVWPQITRSTVAGGGIVTNNIPVTITLPSSQTILTYRLLKDGVVVSTRASTGQALSFSVTDPGTYTITAGLQDYFVSMTGSATVVASSASEPITQFIELPFIYQLPWDLDAIGLHSESPLRVTNNYYTSILAVPYEGIATGYQNNVVGAINQLFGSVIPDGLVQCIEVSGINMSDPQASKGLIYLRFEANSRPEILILLTGSQYSGITVLRQDASFIDPAGLKYGLDYSVSGTNTLFTVTGPQLDGCTFTLRKVVQAQQAHTWPVIGTMTPSSPFNPSNLPSGVIPVSSSLLTNGDYVLYNEVCGVIASNPVTIVAAPLVLTTYSISGGGESASAGTVTLSGKQDLVTYELYLNDVFITSALGSALGSNNNRFTGLNDYGRYRVKAEYQGQEAWMDGEVGVWPEIIRSTVGGGGTVISDIPVAVTLPTSQTILTYNLLKDGTVVNTCAGTGQALSFSVTDPGTYTITAGLQDYFVPMTGNVTVVVALNIYSISGGGEIADGSTGTVILWEKQDQVTYRLYLNNNLLSNTLGSNNSFTGLTGYGRYRVKAVYQDQEAWMDGEVGVWPEIIRSTVGGGGTVIGDIPVAVTLPTSQTILTYNLLKDGVVVNTCAGTGQALSFSVTDPGAYTITAGLQDYYVPMTGNVTIVVAEPLVLNIYSISGGGETTLPAATITMSGKQDMVAYELYLDNTLCNISLNSNNSFTGLTSYGRYRVKAVYEDQEAWMDGEVGVWPLITRSTVGGGGTVTNNVPVAITLPTSQWMLTYNLLKDGIVVSTCAGTGGALSFSVTDSGTYTITAGLQDYYVPMAGNVTVVVAEPLVLNIYSISGGGESSIGTVILSGRQDGVTYKLYLDNALCSNTIDSNNSFTGLAYYGRYRVKAVYQDQEAWMTGEVGVWPAITRSTVGGGGTVISNVPVTITLPTSQTILMYNLLKDGTVVSTCAGTGQALFFSVTDPGTYTITAGLQDYYVPMTGSVTVTVEISHAPEFTSSLNYVAEKIYVGLTGANSVNNVVYLDGFGRTLQEVAVGAAPGGTADIVTPHAYGLFGRVEKECLPGTRAGNGSANGAISWSIYGSDANNAFTLNTYDNSPLDRVVKQTGPGAAWQSAGKGVTTAYALNEGSRVRKYRVSDTGALSLDGYYTAGTLQKVTMTDEDDKQVYTYTDNQDRVVLSVGVEDSGPLETYSVYDDRGQLRYVLSPEASSQMGTSINTTILEQFAYYYDYDLRGRMTSKRLPGCETIYMVYDGKDRLVLSQDGKQRAENANKWSYSLYDGKNRVTETGEVTLTGSTTHAALQSAASASLDYTPSGMCTPMQYTFYDNYAALSGLSGYDFVPVTGYPQTHYDLVTGMVTVVKTRVLDVTEQWLLTATYYDDHGRVIQTVSDNLQGGTSRLDMAYDFTGNLLKQRECHIHSSRTDIVETTNTYDNRSRLVTSSTALNGGTAATTTYAYDAVGRLTGKKMGATTETMAYNVRGWLTSKQSKITSNQSKLFTMNLRYQNPAGGTVTRWNGNISEWDWQQGTGSFHMYAFTYDEVNRLTAAVHKHKGSSWVDHTSPYNEQGITYDKNGNILSLQRTAAGKLVDDLVYGYTGNRMEALSEAVRTSPTGDVYAPGTADTGTYSYDANGNMLSDSREGLNFSYNLLNLLREVKVGTTVKATYTWLADGSKLRVRDASGNGFDYLGSLTYTGSGNTLTLESAAFPGGVIRATGSGAAAGSASQQETHYFLTDHLGSVRVIVDAAGNVKERNNYYAFGAKHIRSDYPQSDNRYDYNGKEEQTTGNLKFLDYGARMYDARIGRWFNTDPCAEKYYPSSPFAYCANNSIKFIDIDGCEWFYYSVDGWSDPTWNWRDESEYHTGIYDQNGNEYIIQGKGAVVVGQGSMDERLGVGGNLFGEGAILATFTVYGPKGAKDIKTYRGFTMSSDFSKFGAIDNGEYTVNYRDPGKSRGLTSNWAVNNTNPVDCLFGVNSYPGGYSTTQKNGVYFHSSNSNGWAGAFYDKKGNLSGVSVGCILIVPSGHGENGWNEFNEQLSGVTSFHFVLNRTTPMPYRFTTYPAPSPTQRKYIFPQRTY